MPKLLERLEQLNDELGDVDYVIGVAKNSRLLELADPLRASVAELSKPASSSFAASRGCPTHRSHGLLIAA
jgi:hypothetical protein